MSGKFGKRTPGVQVLIVALNDGKLDLFVLMNAEMLKASTMKMISDRLSELKELLSVGLGPADMHDSILSFHADVSVNVMLRLRFVGSNWSEYV